VDVLAGEDAEAEAVGGGVFEVGRGEVQFAFVFVGGEEGCGCRWCEEEEEEEIGE